MHDAAANGADDQILAVLRSVITPTAEEWTRLRALAFQAWEWRDPDRALAELVDDSLLGGVAMRDSGDTIRSLCFAFTVDDSSPFDIELEVESTFSGLTLRGQIVPPTEVALELVEVRRLGNGSGDAASTLTRTPIVIDGYGGFVAASRTAVMVRIEATCRGATSSTPWVTL